jgi:Flp pilus assembly protein CpaB
MSFARIRLIVAALAFVGWLAWLAVAVANKGTVQIVSTAQLTEATHVVVAEVKATDAGEPLTKAKVLKVIRGPADVPGEIDVERLDKAVTPLPVNDARRISAGEYVLPLVKTPFGWKVAGLPRSPGFEGASPDQPLVYPWTEDVRIQLRKLGVLKD